MNSILYKVATGTKCHKLFINNNGELCLTVYKDSLLKENLLCLSSDGVGFPTEESTGHQVHCTFYTNIILSDNCR